MPKSLFYPTILSLVLCVMCIKSQNLEYSQPFKYLNLYFYQIRFYNLGADFNCGSIYFRIQRKLPQKPTKCSAFEAIQRAKLKFSSFQTPFKENQAFLKDQNGEQNAALNHTFGCNFGNQKFRNFFSHIRNFSPKINSAHYALSCAIAQYCIRLRCSGAQNVFSFCNIQKTKI